VWPPFKSINAVYLTEGKPISDGLDDMDPRSLGEWKLVAVSSNQEKQFS
jgi:hypothetical protein